MEQRVKNKQDSTSEPVTLGSYLRQAREQGGVTTRKLAATLHLHASYISRLETGVLLHPSPEVLQRIARVLRVSYEDLFALSGHLLPQDLPSYRPYLRVKYDMSDRDFERLADYFTLLREHHRIVERQVPRRREEQPNQ